ncbi:uncharacterized protein CC84DRAFT_1249207 [Paraphaeosphaeria sporulosa]|uniref:Ig-like domain-containing protein n=1 Tax=Paraphaeosphaeria sporulosa TaxID=1460663 RepID=A0A177CAN6_9PLEO|nr:uncharacterized protein CC84DRAFT_1249207 [Paraphaeosphaeria sporulosa]OAG03828.1 hypothetical protein CC84DRAFT_1249207 [Paraphaeosphaeria sporulosa]
MMGISLIFQLLLASSAAAIDIPTTPTWPSGRCTDKSLTIPSWTIKDYVVKGGVATFQVENRASASTDCCSFITCSPGKEKCDGSAGSSGKTVTWKKGADGINVISVTEVWYCSDEGDRTIFTASGSTKITSCDGDDCLSPITYLAQGGLTLPVPLTPAQPLPPAGYDAPTCAKVGEDQWDVSGVEYKNYTKSQCKQWYIPEEICRDNNAQDFVSKGQYLSLNVTNNAISHTVGCGFTPSYNNYDLPSVLRCTGGNFNEITLDVSWSGAAPNFNLKVEQLWYCLDNPKANVNPTVIVASGSSAIPLRCTSTPGITGTADDIVTICTDTASSHSIDGKQIAKQKLPPYSLITAYPVHGGCTFDSIINPTFYYRGMFFETNPYPQNNPDSATLKRFTAGLTGPGFKDFFFYQNKAISGQGIKTTYTCAVYYDGKPKDQHYNCTYALNPHTKVITQEKTWECGDKNPKQPLYFTGSGEFDWSVDPSSDCYNSATASNPSTYCYWYDDMATLQPGVPYDIPKVRASLVNVLPPDLGQPAVKSVATSSASDTLRVNKEWKFVTQAK